MPTITEIKPSLSGFDIFHMPTRGQTQQERDFLARCENDVEGETLADVCRDLHIDMSSYGRTNDNEQWLDVDAWECQISFGYATLTVPFYCGRGHEGCAPSVEDVLSCLVSDMFAGQGTFEDHCFDTGANLDSRKDYATWEQCVEIARLLGRFLGAARDRVVAAAQNE